ncbi:MAG: hypothetical protein K2N05_01550 [Muribaculaceae bacterium]|nr:hypothetical protein [Muribaculaceae bacterium]
MSGFAPTITLPSTDLIDFSNPEEAYGQAMLICNASAEAARKIADGNFSPITKIRTSAREWILGIEPHIDSYSPAQALRLAQAYDHLHRLAYSAPPLPGIVDRQVIRSLRALIAGDTAVDQSLLYRLITLGLNRGIKEYRGLPLRWQSQKLARWYKKYSEGTADLIEEEIRILLDSDLTAFTGRNQAPFKEQLRGLLKDRS